MVLRKERQPFGAAAAAAAAASAAVESVRNSANSAMSNEQPVSKRQRIDGLINGSNSSNSSSSNGDPTSRYCDNATSTNATLHAAATSNQHHHHDIDELDHAQPAGLIADYCIPTNGALTTATATLNGANKCHDEASKFVVPAAVADSADDVWLPLNDGLLKQCLCSVSTDDLQRPFRPHYARTAPPSANNSGTFAPINSTTSNLQRPLVEWPAVELVSFLSQLQLLFDIYLKQSRCGRLCRAIGAALAIAEHRSSAGLVDEIIALADYGDRFVQFLAARVLCTFLVFQDVERSRCLNDWLKQLVDNLFVETPVVAAPSAATGMAGAAVNAQQRVSFSLEIFRRILEWNDVDLHPLDEDECERETEDDVGDMDGDGRRLLSDEDDDEDDGLEEEEDDELEEDLDSEDGEMAALMARSSGRAHVIGVGQRALPPIEANYFNFYTEYGNHQSVSAAAAAAAAASAAAAAATAASSASTSGTVNTMITMSDASVATSASTAAAANRRHARPVQSSPATSSSVSITSSSASASSREHSDREDEHVHDDDDDDEEEDDDDDDEDDEDGGHSRHINSRHNRNQRNGCTYLELGAVARHDDTTALKCVTVRHIAAKWPALLVKMNGFMGTLMDQHRTHQQQQLQPNSVRVGRTPNANENLLHTFLELWRAIIAGSAKNAFLTVNDTQPFYDQLDEFETAHVRRHLPPTIYKQVLQLFNAVLCYGDALATETAISNETCNLAYRIIRHLQGDLLQSMPVTDVDNPVSLIGYAGRSTGDTMVDAKQRRAMGIRQMVAGTELGGSSGCEGGGGMCDMDKTFLQNMVLLVLKSVAVSVRDMRSDSSDSSIESTNQRQEAHSEFRNIAKDMRPLLEKLNVFAKERLQLHPALHFSRMLVTLFIDQDDFLIEAMVCTLDVANNFQFGQCGDAAFDELIALVNPVYTFLEFLEQTNRNWELLLNYLISIETCFLLYFLRFIKYIATHWTQFEVGCREFGELYGQRDVCGHTMALLGELRKEIGLMVAEEKFPYDIWPVLKLMDKCAASWDGPL